MAKNLSLGCFKIKVLQSEKGNKNWGFTIISFTLVIRDKLTSYRMPLLLNSRRFSSEEIFINRESHDIR